MCCNKISETNPGADACQLLCLLVFNRQHGSETKMDTSAIVGQHEQETVYENTSTSDIVLALCLQLKDLPQDLLKMIADAVTEAQTTFLQSIGRVSPPPTTEAQRTIQGPPALVRHKRLRIGGH